MKKKLEAELISIAHRILKLKNKEDVRELHNQTQKLYEKLSVLLFVEEHFSDVKPSIGLHDIEVNLEQAFDFDEKIVVGSFQEDKLVKDSEVKIIPLLDIEDEKGAILEISNSDKKQITIEEVLESVTTEPFFDKIEELKNEIISPEIAKIIEDKVENTKYIDIPQVQEFIFDKVDSDTIAINLNDKLKKSINIGLNDRLAFEQHLFAGSSEDYNRVISQLSTFDNIDDAKKFVIEMVKPDYDNWTGKEEFAERFMEIVENKFI